ncbi:methyltransferase domain-containing protein [bacterium]|nr:methyltransferase domain-containing protein [bacterium]
MNFWKRLKNTLSGEGISSPGASGDGIFYGVDPNAEPDYSVFRGYFDCVKYEDGFLTVSGWMLSIYGAYDECVMYIDGKRRGKFEQVKRPDVAHGLPTIDDAEDSGFQFRMVIHEVELERIVKITVRGVMEGREVGQMETGFIKDLYTIMPSPPIPLIQRVDGHANPEFYHLKGIQNFCEIREVIEQHIEDAIPVEKMLDWGCGSGRLIGFFYNFSSIPDLYGCDIDAEAVEWAQKQFPKAHFSAIDPYPPTLYPENEFELIISFSVFTHLDRDTQMQWLKEMQRVLKPGGLFITTVHGMIAARTILNEDQIDELVNKGFFDQGEDTKLEGIAPEQYYRSFFMTKQYIRKQWSNYFEILEHLEQGASNYHDIVVMRKPERLAAKA